MVAAETRGHRAQRPVINVNHTTPGNATWIDVQLVVPMHVVINECRKQVVRRTNSVEIARKVEIDIGHGYDLGVTATCRSIFYNPMALPGEAPRRGEVPLPGEAPLPGEESPRKLFIEGGYYNDELVRTPDGWRIRERIEESSYSTMRSELIQPG